jgi:hypothetical protein
VDATTRKNPAIQMFQPFHVLLSESDEAASRHHQPRIEPPQRSPHSHSRRTHRLFRKRVTTLSNK